jgi:hypothetical protein
MLSWIVIVLTYWNNTRTHYPDIDTTSLCSSSIMMRAACLAEKQQNNYIVFGLTPPVLESPIYRTLGEHAYHYNTDAAGSWINFLYTVFCKQNNKAIGLWKKNPDENNYAQKSSTYVINLYGRNSLITKIYNTSYMYELTYNTIQSYIYHCWTRVTSL